MFSIFKKKTALQKMENKYTKLLVEARSLSSSNRKESDAKYAEADRLLKDILKLEKG